MEAPIVVLALVLVFALFAGFLPGMHPNSIGAIMVEMFGAAQWLPVALMLLLGAHISCEFFASIFMGVPDSETEVSALPGVRMMMDGRGREAAMVVAFSVVAATVAAIALTPVANVTMPMLMEIIEPNTHIILIFAAMLLIGVERKIGRMAKALVIFALAVALGQLAFSLQIRDALFPMFVGFFTIPGIMLSSHGKMIDVKQQEAKLAIDADLLIPIAVGVLLGGLADLLPGISTPAQIAVFATLLIPIDDAKRFMALASSIAASHAVFAITAASSIGKARVGAVALANGIEPINNANVAVLMFAFALAVGAGAFVLLVASKWAAKHIKDIDFDSAGKLLAAYLVAAVFLVSGLPGILILLTATSIGCLPILWGVRRTHVMGGIIGPSVVRLIV